MLSITIFCCSTFIFIPLFLLDSPVTNTSFVYYPLCGMVLGYASSLPVSKGYFCVYWWCIAALFGMFYHFCICEREAAWGTRGSNPTPRYYPYDGVWSEKLSIANFEAAVVRQLVYILLGAIFTLRIVNNWISCCKRLKDMPDEERYGSRMRCEHISFACTAGYYLFYFFQQDLDFQLVVHHVVCIILSILASFWQEIPGVTFGACIACLLEIGSLSYNSFYLYGMRNTYLLALPLSNFLSLAIGIKFCFVDYWNSKETSTQEGDDGFRSYRYFLFCVGVALLCGRQLEWFQVLF